MRIKKAKLLALYPTFYFDDMFSHRSEMLTETLRLRASDKDNIGVFSPVKLMKNFVFRWSYVIETHGGIAERGERHPSRPGKTVLHDYHLFCLQKGLIDPDVRKHRYLLLKKPKLVFFCADNQ
ncbi:hypothetical protein NB704_002451 [Pantoea ananatis]|nr:hypothetical protein [Pantoea ananatis]